MSTLDGLYALAAALLVVAVAIPAVRSRRRWRRLLLRQSSTQGRLQRPESTIMTLLRSTGRWQAVADRHLGEPPVAQPW